MNNQARGCELKCKYNVQGICHAYGECIAKELFIAELEEIKAEIRERCIFSISKIDVLDIIDNHIKENKE